MWTSATAFAGRTSATSFRYPPDGAWALFEEDILYIL